jgi:hypothetical protein
MREFHFKADNLTDNGLQRWRKLSTPSSLPARIFGWTMAVVTVIYAVNHPGEIKITSPADGTSTNKTFIAVTGTVDNKWVKKITLNINENPRIVSVEKGAFASKVPVVRGRNIIQASVGGVASNMILPSNLILVTAAISHMDIWTELTWEGPGDVDLHLYLPNREHCYYEQMKTKSGAWLDIDNEVRDGPEHIILENAIPGEYRVTVLYYESVSDPPRPVPYQVTVRLRDGEIQRSYAGVLHGKGEEQDVDTFALP